MLNFGGDIDLVKHVLFQLVIYGLALTNELDSLALLAILFV